MIRPIRLATLAGVLLAAWLFASTGRAGEIAKFTDDPVTSHATYDRFASGYPSAPSANADPRFIGAGYDLSGVGWLASDPTFGVSLVSPRHFIGSAHVNFDTTPNRYAPGTQINFVNASGELYAATVEVTRVPLTTFTNSAGNSQTLPSDVILGTFTAPVPAGFASYAIPVGPQSAFTGLPMLNYGQNAGYGPSPHLGRNNIDVVSLTSFNKFTTEATVVAAYDYQPAANGEFKVIVGDSGSPSFIPRDGKLLLLGGHYARYTDDGAPDGSLDTFLPEYADQLNAFMALDANETYPTVYTLQVTPIPEPGVLFAAAAGVAVLRRRRAKAHVTRR